MRDIKTVAGMAAITIALGLLIPVLVDYLDNAKFNVTATVIVLSATAFAVSGGITMWRGRSRRNASFETPMPKAIRAAITVNILFLAFFALEFSDGLVRQQGRIF
jgi:hypothetical protein